MRLIAATALFAATTLSAQPAKTVPTRSPVSDATQFLARAEHQLDSLLTRARRAQWVQQNFITDDTEILNAEASRDYAVAVQQLAVEAKKFDAATLPTDVKRKLMLLKLALVAPPPADAKKATELSQLAASLDAWRGWHTIAVPMRDKYARFVELSNEGARGLGFANTGVMWRSGYDMAPDAFAADMDRVWNQLRPLYLALHAYTRTQLRA